MELMREAKLMLNLRHPNITQFMGVVMNKPDLCIVTEFIERGSLYQILHNREIRLHNDHLRQLMLGACKGMAYLHGARILHRDLKSHNLLVDTNWTVKADFGLSRAIGEAQATMTACGTPCWTAPEVLRNQHYSFEADVYSFGIVMWEMITRQNPYPNMVAYNVVIAVATKGLRPHAPPPTSNKELMAIMIKCWDEDPGVRPTFEQLCQIFADLKFPRSTPKPTQSPYKVRHSSYVPSGKSSSMANIGSPARRLTYMDGFSLSNSRNASKDNSGSDSNFSELSKNSEPSVEDLQEVKVDEDTEWRIKEKDREEKEKRQIEKERRDRKGNSEMGTVEAPPTTPNTTLPKKITRDQLKNIPLGTPINTTTTTTMTTTTTPNTTTTTTTTTTVPATTSAISPRISMKSSRLKFNKKRKSEEDRKKRGTELTTVTSLHASLPKTPKPTMSPEPENKKSPPTSPTSVAAPNTASELLQGITSVLADALSEVKKDRQEKRPLLTSSSGSGTTRHVNINGSGSEDSDSEESSD